MYLQQIKKKMTHIYKSIWEIVTTSKRAKEKTFTYKLQLFFTYMARCFGRSICLACFFSSSWPGKARTAIFFFFGPRAVCSQSTFSLTMLAFSRNIYRQLTKFLSFFLSNNCFPRFSLEIKSHTLFSGKYGIKIDICYSEHILSLTIDRYKCQRRSFFKNSLFLFFFTSYSPIEKWPPTRSENIWF